jgi:hypothetical protein
MISHEWNFAGIGTFQKWKVQEGNKLFKNLDSYVVCIFSEVVCRSYSHKFYKPSTYANKLFLYKIVVKSYVPKLYA